MIESTYSCSSFAGLVSSKRRLNLPPYSPREARVETDALGVADVQVAVGLGREAGLHPALPLAALDVCFDDLFDEIERGVRSCGEASEARDPTPDARRGARLNAHQLESGALSTTSPLRDEDRSRSLGAPPSSTWRSSSPRGRSTGLRLEEQLEQPRGGRAQLVGGRSRGGPPLALQVDHRRELAHRAVVDRHLRQQNAQAERVTGDLRRRAACRIPRAAPRWAARSRSAACTAAA